MTKKAIMTIIMEQVERKLSEMGNEHFHDKDGYHTYVLLICTEDENNPTPVALSGHRISTQQYQVLRAIQGGCTVHIENVADGNDLLAQLVYHWLGWTTPWSDKLFSVTQKESLCRHVRVYNPNYHIYSVVSNLSWMKRLNCMTQLAGYVSD